MENNKAKPTAPDPTRQIVVLQSEQLPESLDVSELVVASDKKYALGEIIAQGGMGVIYEATDLNCKRSVAMKILNPVENQTPEELLRFVEEAQITAQLEHPNIVPIHEVALDDQGRVFYTMKHVKGQTLTDILVGLRRGNPTIVEHFPLTRLVNVFQKVCDAVAFAHAHRIVHRDLKPDNVMIAEYGEVLVVDWGLAKLTKRHPDHPDPIPDEINDRATEPNTGAIDQISKDLIRSLRQEKIGSGLRTMSGHIMGTPGFMAPEQADIDQKKLSLLSDIYSLGAILYSILTLRPPLRVSSYQTAQALVDAIHANQIRPPVDYNKRTGRTLGDETYIFPHCADGNIPEPLSRIAMRALSGTPGSRYSTVLELQEDLEAYQAGTMWHLVTDDDMADSTTLTHWEILGGNHEIAEGALRLFGGEPQTLLFRQELPGDVRIEYECMIRSIYLNNLGCFIGAINAGNRNTIPYSGYEFCYGAYDNSLNLLSRADQKIWTQTASPLTRNQVYRICAERSGNTLSLTVNGERIFSVKDPDPLSGANRTAVGLYGWLSDVRYTRVRIFTRGTPWQADVLDLAERQLQKGNYLVAKTLYQDILDSYPGGMRLKRAEAGLEKSYKRELLDEQLKTWKLELQAAWPKAKIELTMVNDGLTAEMQECEISNLSPLTGLPLTALYCQNNNIDSLEPLRGMKLEVLNCCDNPITSLEPLRGMPLRTLACENCLLSNLEPLQNIPLTHFNCGGCQNIESLSPLENADLNFLSCWGNRITSLEPLSGMKLTGLFCGGNQIESLAPLGYLPIKMLHCSGNRIRTLEPLANCELSWLHCASNQIESLEPLRGMPLNMLSCHCNKINSLEPLAHAPLGTLTCGSNQLTSIDPYTEKPPTDFAFDCGTLSISELQRIRTMWAERPELENHLNHIDVIIALREERYKDLYALAHQYGEYLYLFIPQFKTWSDARRFCENLRGDLVTILSAEENDFVSRLFPGGCWFWLGLLRTESGLQWVTGEPYEYDNFSENLQRHKPGPKVFNGSWCSEDIPNAQNCFMIKWPSFITDL